MKSRIRFATTHLIPYWIALALSAGILVCRAQNVAELATGTNFVPPEQTEPWIAPATKLDPVILRAIAELFDDGMADPRGCEYREIEIVETPKWSIKTHGWVIPGSGTHRYGIGWNGVVYPLKSVGAKVDLEKEIAGLPSGPIRRFRGNGNGWPMSDQGSLRPSSALPLQVAFLLRLGYGTLADEAWQQGYAGDVADSRSDPFPEMANLWLGRFFNEAIMAYLRGDYADCVSICARVTEAEESEGGHRTTGNVVATCRRISRRPALAITDAKPRGESAAARGAIYSGAGIWPAIFWSRSSFSLDP
jgi:hypothetical protein